MKAYHQGDGHKFGDAAASGVYTYMFQAVNYQQTEDCGRQNLSQIPDMSYLQKSKCPCFKNFAKSNLVK